MSRLNKRSSDNFNKSCLGTVLLSEPRLSRVDQIMVIEKGIKTILHVTFNNLRQNGKHGDRSIITGVYLAPLLNKGVTFAVFHRVGYLHVENERLINLATLGAITGGAIRRRRALILSMPEAL